MIKGKNITIFGKEYERKKDGMKFYKYSFTKDGNEFYDVHFTKNAKIPSLKGYVTLTNVEISTSHPKEEYSNGFKNNDLVWIRTYDKAIPNTKRNEELAKKREEKKIEKLDAFYDDEELPF